MSSIEECVHLCFKWPTVLRGENRLFLAFEHESKLFFVHAALTNWMYEVIPEAEPCGVDKMEMLYTRGVRSCLPSFR